MSRVAKVALCWLFLIFVVAGFGLALARAFDQGVR